jgi:hypothetical protein
MAEFGENATFLLIFFGSLLLVALIVLALSFLGGWRRLGSHYAVGTSFNGRRFHFQSLQLRGWCGYNGCITAGSDAFHLYFSVWFPFRLGHPPLLIPWNDVRARGERRWWIPIVVLSFDREPNVALRISRRLARRLAGETRGNFRVPGDPRDTLRTASEGSR